MDWTWYLFRFDGRINRAKLWLGGLVLLGLMMALGTVIAAIHVLFGSVSGPDMGRSPPAPDQAVRHLADHVGLLRDLDQATA